jgi:hypothetical protein
LILGKFFNDAKIFRSLQAEWNTLVTGEVLLDFFARTKHYLSNNPFLVLIVPSDHVEAAMMFLESEGYAVFKDSKVKNSWSHRDYVCPMLEYAHTNHAMYQEKNVKVFLLDTRSHAESSPLDTFLLGKDLDITVCQNFATWKKVYSIFPRTTFLQKESYFHVLCTESGFLGDRLREPSIAGYRIKDIAWYGGDGTASADNQTIACRRRIGDRKTWIIDLPTAGVTSSPIPDGVIESSVFRVEQEDVKRPTAQYYSITYGIPLTYPILRGDYMLPDPGSKPKDTYDNDIDALMTRLDASMVFELPKLPPSERPSRWREIHENTLLTRQSHMMAGLRQPSYWTYYDDDNVVEYLRRLEDELEAGRLLNEPQKKRKRLGQKWNEQNTGNLMGNIGIEV